MKNNFEFQKWYAEADAAGKAAAEAFRSQVVPMVVQEVGLDDQPYKGSKSYFVADGACGFAWVKIYPGNCPFANWLKKNGLASKAYGGGVEIWVSDYNQSIQLKEAYAGAAAKVLQGYGVRAYSGSRLD